MSALLASVRGIGRDLIDKRLWPVAVLLLAALVAVPVLIGGSSGPEPVPPGIVAAAEPGAAAATAPATASTTGKRATTRTTASKAEGRGEMNDPFFDPPASPSEAGAGAAGGGAAGGAATRAVAKSPTGEAAPRPGTAPEAKAPASAKAKAEAATPSRTAPSSAPRATPTPTTTAPASSYLRTVVRVNGAAGGKALPISRLTPIGGARNPGAVFLGVAKAGARYAVFVLGPHATSRGPATCKGETDCRMIGLRAGQTQVVTVRRPNGAVRRFTLRVQSIRAVRASAARARAARARIHADGRKVVRDLRRHAPSAAALRTARYDSRAGLLRAARARPVKNASE
jgi:hypothetical protein